MKKLKALNKIQTLLEDSGVIVNGSNPWDIKLNYKYITQFYNRIIRYGSLSLGESYMDGWWTCERLDQFFTKILSADLEEKINPWRMVLPYIKASLFNLQKIRGSKKVAKEHYDLPVELYKSFLDPYNQYTCGYFKDTEDLNVAQKQKMDLICKKLKLNKDDHLLDIGCGWGGFAKFVAENYGCHVTGIIISEEQYRYTKNHIRGLGIKTLLMDYRNLRGQEYSKISCIGMIEHVGRKNYKNFMQCVNRSLVDSGIFLLHTIGGLKSVVDTDPWIKKYIFPNSMLPSVSQIAKASEGLFVLNDFHNFGLHYDKTLMSWYDNFKKNYHTIKSNNFDDRFYRMWEYYFLSCAGSFRSGKNQLYQFVFSKNYKGEYIPVR